MPRTKFFFGGTVWYQYTHIFPLSVSW